MILDGLLSFGTAAYNNQQAIEREKIARKENYRYGEMAAENADRRTRDLYKDFQSPNALLQQYKEAGLSPSLMFGGGGSGAGGMTQGAQGEGTSGISPTTYGAGQLDPISEAQVALTLAQTKKTEAETKTIDETRKPTVENLQADLNKKIAETNNIGLKNAWQEFENAIEMLELQYQASTTEERIAQFYKTGEMLAAKTRSAKARGEIDETTKEDVKKYIREQARNMLADTILKQTQTKLSNSTIELQKQQIQDLADQILQRGKQTQINRETLEEQVNQWAIQNGLTDKKLKQELTDIIWSNSNQTMKNLLDFLSLL